MKTSLLCPFWAATTERARIVLYLSTKWSELDSTLGSENNYKSPIRHNTNIATTNSTITASSTLLHFHYSNAACCCLVALCCSCSSHHIKHSLTPNPRRKINAIKPQTLILSLSFFLFLIQNSALLLTATATSLTRWVGYVYVCKYTSPEFIRHGQLWWRRYYAVWHIYSPRSIFSFASNTRSPLCHLFGLGRRLLVHLICGSLRSHSMVSYLAYIHVVVAKQIWILIITALNFSSISLATQIIFVSLPTN